MSCYNYFLSILHNLLWVYWFNPLRSKVYLAIFLTNFDFTFIFNLWKICLPCLVWCHCFQHNLTYLICFLFFVFHFDISYLLGSLGLFPSLYFWDFWMVLYCTVFEFIMSFESSFSFCFLITCLFSQFSFAPWLSWSLVVLPRSLCLSVVCFQHKVCVP